MIKIALIDDHTLFLEGVVSVLKKRADIEVMFYNSDPFLFLKELENHKLDLILTDISMPKLNGIELITKIREQDATVKILVLSSHHYYSGVQRINGFIPKNCATETLYQAIESIVVRGINYFDASITFTKDFSEVKKQILSPREIEIIRLIAAEKTTEEISGLLFLSKNTIDTHRKNIFIKLNVQNLAGLIQKAGYLGYI